MSYLIQPDSDVILLRNIPLDLSQEHSICFDDAGQQERYFKGEGRAKFTLTTYSYQRHSLGVIKVEKCADDLYDVNYMMFRNTAFGNKWFYAFVTDVEYINNVTTAVYYKIDPLQTWLFDFNIGQSFVVREMPKDDYANEQLVDEPLETGEYVVSHLATGGFSAITDSDWYNTRICVLVTNAIINVINSSSPFFVNPLTSGDLYVYPPIYQENASPQNPRLFELGDVGSVRCNNMSTGLLPLLFPNNDLGRSNLQWYIRFLESANASNSIVTMFIVPHFVDVSYSMTPYTQGTDKYYKVSAVIDDGNQQFKISRPSWVGTTDNPLPNTEIRNMKLYNYPYCFPFISDGEGDIQPFKPQYFYDNDGFFNFEFMYSCTSTLDLCFIPNNYKGMALNLNESYAITKCPQIPWITDYYNTYWAEQKVNITSSLIGDFLSAGSEILGGIQASAPAFNKLNYANANYGRLLRRGHAPQTIMKQQRSEIMQNMSNSSLGALAPVIDIGQTLGNLGIARHTSDRNHGVPTTDILAVRNIFKPYYGIMSITKEMAQVIDDYFTRFGYATHRSKVPNWRTNQRPVFNYVQTKDTVIDGHLPQEDAEEIVNIFEKGITWWHRTGNNIGNYTLNNRASSRGQYRT